MTVHYQSDHVTLHHSDCLDALRELPDCSIDAVVTDPPYGLGFMGHEWDQPGEFGALHGNGKPATTRREAAYDHTTSTLREGAMAAGRYDLSLSANLRFQLWVNAWAVECLRVLKPGGHLLASGSSRTWHRLTAGIEDAGFEIRDSIAWMYGSGFPKSMDVSKAIDKHLGVERAVTREASRGLTPGEVISFDQRSSSERERRDDPETAAAAAAAGWGTALKPAFEPIVMARKPLAGTVAANVLKHGTGALNIDASRLSTEDDLSGSGSLRAWRVAEGREGEPSATRRYTERGATNFAVTPGPRGGAIAGRWPTNVILDESQAVELDAQSGVLTSGYMRPEVDRQTRQGDAYGLFARRTATATYGDTGAASRFFYVAKAGKSERPFYWRHDCECEHDKPMPARGKCRTCKKPGIRVAHPTVKPLSLMRHLVRLVTPPGGTVLEPFTGSGTTVAACLIEGFDCIAIEREADYLPLIVKRIKNPMPPKKLGSIVKVAEDQGDIFESLGIEVG